MAKKQIIALLYGGKSTEHEISIRSARNIAESVDNERFALVLIGVDKGGAWHLQSRSQLNSVDVMPINYNLTSEIKIVPGQSEIKTIDGLKIEIDVLFPIIHGTGGEDGTIQGFCKWLNLPFVGSGVLGSSLCLDKEVAKRLMRDAGINNAKFLSYHSHERNSINFEDVTQELGLPLYIKPPNLGSSVGISKVNTKEEFEKALDHAFDYDRKVLIEESVVGREIECAVLGNETPKASTVGEVVTNTDTHSFYDYDAKYLDASGSTTKIPADLPEDLIERIRNVAIKTYRILECEGLARVDVFIKEDGEIVVNEVNTLPGFTDISMYPKLWEAVGLSYSDLITTLIDLALERFKEEQSKKLSY